MKLTLGQEVPSVDYLGTDDPRIRALIGLWMQVISLGKGSGGVQRGII